ncbi:MAG TPA: molecular chaperone TorD family protein [Casimicrobium sp.]|jgi:TorA maturation chaperone TorD|nr:molecular chaperone TorD family protein [Casimicrobium sp.]
MSEANVAFKSYVSAEDHGRANFYALISRLLAAAPDQALLAAIAGSPPLTTEDDGAPLPLAWSKLIAASMAMDADAAHEEYEQLFIGVGRAPVNLHASHHLTGFMMEQPLADVRGALATLGFARVEVQTVVEDHLASLCEVMRLLIVGANGIEPSSVAVQREFFGNHIAPWFEICCGAIAKSSLANYYAVVAQFIGSFLQVERDAFAIEP